MSEETNLIYSTKIKTGESVESVKSLTTQMRSLRNELAQLEPGSKAFTEVAKRAGDLQDKIEDTKNAVDAFNPEKKFQAFANALGGVANGFAVVQGGMALFGTENKDVEKAILKTQAAMAIATGVNGLLGMKDSLKLVKLVAIDTFGSMKAAMIATGIGAFVVALGLILGNWEKIKGWVSGASEQQAQLNRLAQQQVDIEQKKLQHISDQENMLRLQGKSEKEILDLKLAQTRQVALSLMLAAQAQQQVLDAKKANNAKQGKGRYGFFNKLLFGSSDAELAEEQKALDELKAGFNKALSEIAGFHLAEQKIEKDAAKKIEDQEKKRIDGIITTYNLLADYKYKKYLEDRELQQKAFDAEVAALEDHNSYTQSISQKDAEESLNRKLTYEELATLAVKKSTEEQAAYLKVLHDTDMALDKKKREEKMATYASLANTLQQFASVAGEQTAAGKALASAAVLIDTIRGAVNAYNTTSASVGGGPWGIALGALAAAAVSAYGAKAISDINAVQVPGSSSPAMSVSIPSAPRLDPAHNTTRLTNGNDPILTRSLDVKNQKVYIVETEMTMAQKKVAGIKNKATIR